MILLILVLVLVYFLVVFAIVGKISRNFVLSLFVSILVTILSLSLLIYLLKDRVMFLPDATPYEIEVEEHTFGPGLSGFLWDGPDNKKVILYSHGNGGNVTYYTNQIEELNKAAAVFVYDYPGYGRSQGQPTEESVLQSGLEAYDYVKSLGFEEIYLYGYSLGGSVTVNIASKREVEGVVLQSTFARISDVVPGIGKIFAGRDFNTVYNVKDLNTEIPVIVAHSPLDEVVPYFSGRHLYESLPGKNKSWYELPGGHLGFLELGPNSPTMRNKVVSRIIGTPEGLTQDQVSSYYEYIFQTLGLSL